MTPHKARPSSTSLLVPKSTSRWTAALHPSPRHRRRPPLVMLARGVATAALVAASFALGSAGCDSDGSTTSAQTEVDKVPGHGKAERLHAEQQIKQAERAIADYEYAQREELVADVKQRLDDMQKEFGEMEATLAKSSGEQKLATQKNLAELRTRWSESQKELEAAEAAVESEWEGAKRRLTKAYNRLQESVNSAGQRANHTAEPLKSDMTAEAPKAPKAKR